MCPSFLCQEIQIKQIKCQNFLNKIVIKHKLQVILVTSKLLSLLISAFQTQNTYKTQKKEGAGIKTVTNVQKDSKNKKIRTDAKLFCFVKHANSCKPCLVNLELIKKTSLIGNPPKGVQP